VGDAVFDPHLYVDPSVAEMLAGPEADGAFSSVPPGVEGLDWDVEEVGEFFCGEKTVVAVVHGRIMRVDPVSRVSFRCHCRCSLLSRVAGSEAFSGSRTLRLTCSWRVSDRVLDRVADTLLTGFDEAGRPENSCSISSRLVRCRFEG
jgi:hypothetical protein